MTPAAPLVGDVTTCPPAAFSSLTAKAKRLIQSITSIGSFSIAALASSFFSKLGARRVTFNPPSKMPSVAKPRSIHWLITRQI
ncbi:Uncharacterised protein [Vibrio cholerae]|nr:Uncharacterised protein [Vibrio cholerae]